MIFYYKSKKDEQGNKYFKIEADSKNIATDKLRRLGIKPIGTIGEYLNESKLSFLLLEIFKDVEIGKRFNYDPENNRKYYEADFVVSIDNQLTIIEFDGPQHYTNFDNCINDIKKDLYFENKGCSTIRIPYFIQLSDNKVCQEILGVDYPFTDEYPHGFIDTNAPLPVDFCSFGIKRFIEEINGKFNSAQKEIIDSLKTKLDERINLYPFLDDEQKILTVVPDNNELKEKIKNGL